ncbi:hypothetical protein GCM10022402_45640 [Salinactinospora qingdaonensis]|uniref:ABC3 transporter permease C-terminal domain-containing protein n=2 Tax=Salinactinospora qingdaonensis TaxID=702744 RepID=A0ABP7GDL0_9ACTN
MVVALIVVCAQMLRATAVTSPAEEARLTMGAADARVYRHGDTPIEQAFESAYPQPTTAGERLDEPRALTEVLPEGARAIVSRRTDQPRLETDNGAIAVSTYLVDLGDPLARGLFETIGGRPATQPGEVTVSTALSRRLNTTVGETARLAGGERLRVSGLVRDPADHDREFLVAPPQDSPLAAAEFDAATGGSWLVELPTGTDYRDLAHAVNPQGFAVRTRALLLDPPPIQPEAARNTDLTEDQTLLIAAALGLAEVALLTGAAFAITARRRRRDLALLLAIGARPRDAGRVVLAQGALLGAVGALSGTALGIALVLPGRAIGQTITRTTWGSLAFSLPTLLAVVALAIAAGALSAWWPARQIARLSPAEALRETPQPRPRSQGRAGRLRTALWPALAVVGTVLMVVFAHTGAGAPAVAAAGVCYGIGLLGCCGPLLRLAGRLAPGCRPCLASPCASSAATGPARCPLWPPSAPSWPWARCWA